MPSSVHETGAVTVQAALLNVADPESVPLVQVRTRELVAESHAAPNGTVALIWNRCVALCATATPSSVQDAALPTAHDEKAYVPESVPLVHVRCCDTHCEPNGTLTDWYAVVEEALATVVPLNVQEAAGVTEHEALLNVLAPESVPFVQVRTRAFVAESQVDVCGTVLCTKKRCDAPCATATPSSVQS